jgi:hypothetical protein
LRRACSSGKCREGCAGPGRHRAVIGIGFELARAPAGDKPLGGQSPTSHAPPRGDDQRSEACGLAGLVGLGAGGIGSMTSRPPQKSALRRFCMDFTKSSEGLASFGRIPSIRESKDGFHDSSHRGRPFQAPPFREVRGANSPLSRNPLPSQVAAFLVADEPP